MYVFVCWGGGDPIAFWSPYWGVERWLRRLRVTTSARTHVTWWVQPFQHDPVTQLGVVTITFCYCCCSSFPLILLQARGGVSKLQAHPWFRHINWDDLKQGRATVPLGLRERVFKSAAMGDTSSWVPPQRGALTGSSSSRGNPPWLDEF